MPIFGAGTSQFDTDVESATHEVAEEDWCKIMDVCDKAGKCTDDAKGFLKAILKRLGNQDPHIAIKAVTLLDACVKNSGKTFHLEVASRDFETEYQKLINSKKTHPKVVQKLKESLRRWAEEDTFKKDPQLSLIPSMYAHLRSSGIDFTIENPTKKIVLSKDPNVVQSQDEEDQIAKAIELSLKEAGSSPRNTAASVTSSLYPSTNVAAATVQPQQAQKEPRKVRALYDFEAAEDNELTFSTGEIILVIDDADQNWWKGSNHRGEGLFPANFVTSDLTAELESDKKKFVHFDEAEAAAAAAKVIKEPENVEINEEKINRLLHLLHEADPTNSDNDTDEMLNLEKEVNAMGPLIDAELERVDRKHAQLTQLSTDLVEAFSLYHTLMREPQFPTLNKSANYMGYPPTMQPPSSMYNGSMQPMGAPTMGGGPPSMMYSLPPQTDRSLMMHQSMHQFPPMQMHGQPPPSMGPMPGGMPGMPPGMLPRPDPGQSMLPAMQQQQDMHRLPSAHFHNMMPNFPPAAMHPVFPQQQNGPPQAQQSNGQTGPLPSAHQNGPFQQPSNTHIM